MDLVEKLWRSPKIKELSSYIINYEYPCDDYEYFGCGRNEEEVDNGLDFMKVIHKKRNGKRVNICVYEVGYYQSVGSNNILRYFDKDKTNHICLNNEGSTRKSWEEMMK